MNTPSESPRKRQPLQASVLEAIDKFRAAADLLEDLLLSEAPLEELLADAGLLEQFPYSEPIDIEAPQSISSTPRRLKIIARLAERDGWNCRYCGVRLVNPADPTPGAFYIPGERFFGHCGCGEHDPRFEPCDLRGGWRLRPGWAFIEVDHVVPRCRGGSDDDSNLALSCRPCNTNKGTNLL